MSVRNQNKEAALLKKVAVTSLLFPATGLIPFLVEHAVPDLAFVCCVWLPSMKERVCAFCTPLVLFGLTNVIVLAIVLLSNVPGLSLIPYAATSDEFGEIVSLDRAAKAAKIAPGIRSLCVHQAGMEVVEIQSLVPVEAEEVNGLAIEKSGNITSMDMSFQVQGNELAVPDITFPEESCKELAVQDITFPEESCKELAVPLLCHEASESAPDIQLLAIQPPKKGSRKKKPKLQRRKSQQDLALKPNSNLIVMGSASDHHVPYLDLDNEIDQKAEAFIANFRLQLRQQR